MVAMFFSCPPSELPGKTVVKAGTDAVALVKVSRLSIAFPVIEFLALMRTLPELSVSS